MKGLCRPCLKAALGILLTVCAGLGVLGGCVPRSYLAGEVAGILDDGMAAFEADDDFALLEKAFPGDIKLLEALLVSNPNDRRLLALLSRLYGSYAFAFLEPKLELALLAAEGCGPPPPSLPENAPAPSREWVAGYYLKGLEYGRRALAAAHPGWRLPIESTAELDTRLAALDRNDAPALFWYAFNLGAYVSLNTDSIRIVSMAYRVSGAMGRVIALDPEYYHGLAHLVLLAYHARSSTLGGDLAAAQSHYEAIRKINPADFLLADVYYARYYLQQKQERAEFERTLSAVLDRPRQPAPYALLNQLARVRARLYLDAADCLFL